MSEYGIVTAPPTTGGSDTDNSGYKFTVGASDIEISGLRCYLPASVSKTLYLWDNTSTTAIGSVTVSAVAATWTEGLFANPITLSAGKTYIVSAYTSGYYKCALGSVTLNSKITLVGGVYGGSNGGKPTSVSSSNIYGLVDIIIYNPAYKSSGKAIYQATINGDITSSAITWTEDKPTGTSVAVSASTDGTTYTAVTNGGSLLQAGTYTNQAVYIKVELATTDATVTPSISGLNYIVQTAEDAYSIVLEMKPLERFESAAGNIVVAYDGLGTLAGQGGPVLAFEQTFAPSDLIPKPDQNDQEHVSVSMSAVGNLMRVYYTDTKEEEHIEVTMSATGKLTNVNNI